MVTEKAYKRYLEKKKKRGEEGEQDVHVMLDEIARMRGYTGKLVGKRKIHPIVQYVDYLLDKNYGFKPIKARGEYYDRKSKTWKVADKDISPIEQYVDLLGEQRMRGYESDYEYDKWIAKKEGFKSLREKEEFKAAELGLSSIEEYHEFIAKERGFDSYEQYKKYLDGIYAIRGTYTKLIPQEDFDDVLKLIKDRWHRSHEKFIMFCEEFWKDSLGPYFDNGKKDAVVFVRDVEAELDKFHKSRPGSMNIYGTNDIVIGLSFCLEEKATDVILSKDAKTITFRKKKT